MENLEIILSLAGTVLGLVVTALTFIVKSVRNAKAKKLAEQTIKISNELSVYICEAEKKAFTGTNKKAFVMAKIYKFAEANHFAFDKEQISEKVEELITLTKKVNRK